jgi:hypothetical protein
LMFGSKELCLTEIGMETQADRDAIADEAVGQTHESPPPEAQKKNDLSSEEACQRLAASSGAQASIPEKTAESLGERVGDAYSDPKQTNRRGSISRGSERGLSTRFELQRFLTLITGFALGYGAAVLVHGRIREYLGGATEPFQITHPPHGGRHPRGYVQSTGAQDDNRAPARDDSRRHCQRTRSRRYRPTVD